MRDPRLQQLAHNLVNYSCRVQPGEKVLIENTGLEIPFVTALVEEVYKAGGLPFVNLKDGAVNRALQMNITQEMCDLMAKYERTLMEQMQCYIGVRSGSNISETSDVPPEKQP